MKSRMAEEAKATVLTRESPMFSAVMASSSLHEVWLNLGWCSLIWTFDLWATLSAIPVQVHMDVLMICIH